MNRIVLFLFTVASTLALIAGCGGGGKNGGSRSANGVLSVFLDGTPGTASGPTGTWQRIVVYRSDGSVFDERSVELSSGTMQVDIANLPPGTLRVHVGLSASDGGTETGQIETTISGSTATALQTSIRYPIARVRVLPDSSSIKAGLSRQFYAAALTSEGRYVFTNAADWNWSTGSSAVATADDDGTVNGLIPGASTVQATFTPLSLSDSANLTVSSATASRGKWTILVYLNAANNLSPYGVSNLNQMERISTNPDVRFVVQWKNVPGLSGTTYTGLNGTARFQTVADTTDTVASIDASNPTFESLGQGFDMADSDHLAEFIEWGKANFPADHYALVMWDHGNGWRSTGRSLPRTRAISADDEFGTVLDLWELDAALGEEHFDLIAFDACLMQMVETANELDDNTDYLVASEENVPAQGYPYHRSFRAFVESPDAPVTELAQGICDGFMENYATWTSWALHQSVVRTDRVPALRTAVNNLVTALSGSPTVTPDLVWSTRVASDKIPNTSEPYFFYDIRQLSTELSGLTTQTSIINAASALQTAVDDATVYSRSNSRGSYMQGLSIEFARGGVFNGYVNSYRHLKFSETQWDEFLSNLSLNPSTDPTP